MPKVVPQYKDQARARIVEAAAVVFRRSGLPRGTMEEIAREIGVSKGALYLYFPTKLRLLAAVQERQRTRLIGLLEHHLARGDVAEGIVAALEEIVSGEIDPAIWYRLASEAASDPALREVLGEDARDDRLAFRGLLERLGAEGRIHPPGDLDAVAAAVMLLIQGTYAVAALRTDPAETRADLLRSLRLVLGAPGRARRPR